VEAEAKGVTVAETQVAGDRHVLPMVKVLVVPFKARLPPTFSEATVAAVPCQSWSGYYLHWIHRQSLYARTAHSQAACS